MEEKAAVSKSHLFLTRGESFIAKRGCTNGGNAKWTK